MKLRTRSSAIIGTICLATSLAFATAYAGEPAAPLQAAADVALTKVATPQNPTAGAAGPDGTVWIAERAGAIRVLDDRGLDEPVLDISGETTTAGERGLLGVAFDKGFEHFYISYTDLEGTSTIDEFTVQYGAIQTDSRRTVLTQTAAPAVTRKATGRGSTRCSASSCGSTRAAASRTRSRRTTRSWTTRTRRTRSGRTGCATRGGSPSTRAPATC